MDAATVNDPTDAFGILSVVDNFEDPVEVSIGQTTGAPFVFLTVHDGADETSAEIAPARARELASMLTRAADAAERM